MNNVLTFHPRRLDLMVCANDPHGAERYRSMFAEFFDAEVEPAGFHAMVSKVVLGDAIVSHAHMKGQTLSRTAEHTRRNGIDHVQILVYKSGNWRGDYDGRSGFGGPSTVRLADTARPMVHQSSEHEYTALLVPRRTLGLTWNEDVIHGLALDEALPGVQLLAAYVRTLWTTAPGLTDTEASAAVTAAGNLLGGILGGRDALTPPQSEPMERTVLAMAHDYIEAHLKERDLTPASISRALGVSLRTLYRLFEASGGVSSVIRGRRLDRAYAAIAQSGGRRYSLANVAFDHGFVSESHFSRAFLARFGLRPGELSAMKLDAIAASPTRDARIGLSGPSS